MAKLTDHLLKEEREGGRKKGSREGKSEGTKRGRNNLSVLD